MHHNNPMRGWAQLLYTSHSQTIADISLKTGATEAAIRSWIQEGAWDSHRRSITVDKQTQLRLLYDILGNHVAKVQARTEPPDAEGNTKDADLLIKYTAAIKNLEKETGIREIVDVAKLFITWLAKKNLAFAKQVNNYFDGFINERLRKEAE